MKIVKKRRLKKINLHPTTTIIIFTILIIILSGILSSFNVQTTYTKINEGNYTLEQELVAVENLLRYDGMKYIFSNAAKNFVSFLPLSMLLITAIGLGVAKSTGLIDKVFKMSLSKLTNFQVTFLIMFVATISTIINDIGYVILIPLAATLFLTKGRNPLAGISAAFAGVAFGSGVSIFTGSMEVALIPYTQVAAKIIDNTFHVSLTSNLYIIIISSIILSLVGTFIIEKITIPTLGKYREKRDLDKTAEVEIIDFEELEQNKLDIDFREKRGLKYAIITAIVFILAFIYMIIPNLPFSGMLLDMTEKAYVNQLFGANSYFQDGFTYMISLFFLITGIAYGIGAKTIKNDKEVFNNASQEVASISSLIILVFFASQFVAVFKKTNIGVVITASISNLINSIPFGGVPLLIIIVLLGAISNLFLTTPQAKWTILAPVIVPAMMRSNISPQFMQFVLRACDSMTDGITPLLAYFVIFIGYLNIYNRDKEKPYTIGQGIKIMLPYCLIISATWLLIILSWYLIGLPIGPGVLPTL